MTDSSLSWKERAEKAEAERDAAVEAIRTFLTSGVGKKGEGVPPWCTRPLKPLQNFLSSLDSTKGDANAG